VYDSSAKIPSGILNGNVNQFGDFDQCLKVNDENLGIKGQYCLTYVEMTLPSNANEKLKYIIDLMHSHSAFRSRLEDVSIDYYVFIIYDIGTCCYVMCLVLYTKCIRFIQLNKNILLLAGHNDIIFCYTLPIHTYTNEILDKNNNCSL